MIAQWAKRLISRQATSTPPAALAAKAGPKVPDGPRYPPADAGLRVGIPMGIVQANADLLERLRLHAATDSAQFDIRFVRPLLRLAEHINVLPATATTLFSGEMGLFRACLETGFFAFQASDGRIFTGAEGVERRHALESRWRYLCFLAGLLYPLGRTLERVAVTGPRGEVWKRHFNGLTGWANQEAVERLFVSWGGPDPDDPVGPSNATLLVLPVVVGPENLQMLEDGAAELVAALYQLAAGQPASSRIAHQVVATCWERIARREAARRPQAFGRLTSGTHQGPYLAGALRALVEAGAWKLNASALKANRDGLFLQWPAAAADLISFGRSRGYVGWPHDAPTLAALLKASNVVEDRGGEFGLIEIRTDDGRTHHALKIANPLAVLEDFDPSAFADPPAAAVAPPMAEMAARVQESPVADLVATGPAAEHVERDPDSAGTVDVSPAAGEGRDRLKPAQPGGMAREEGLAPRRQGGSRRSAAPAASSATTGTLREAPEIRYAELVPEDIRQEIGTALQIELLGKIVKLWRERGDGSAVMRRLDTGAAIAFDYLTTQILNVPTWVDCMARVGLIYAPPQTPGLRIQKVTMSDDHPPVQAVVLSNLACRRLGL